MSIIVFIIILGILIFVHELGHFIIAKKSGIRVDEFAIGFPPRLFSWKKGETNYSLNLIPIGGYVKIFGENVDEETLDSNKKDSLLNKSRLTQASVLVGGVLFNIIFAWILISISLIAGFPTNITDDNKDKISKNYVVVTSVFTDSPADSAGLEAGDEILRISEGDRILEKEQISVSSIQEFIASSQSEISLSLIRNGKEREVIVSPSAGVLEDKKPAIGISLGNIGIMQLPFFVAIGEGYLMTGQLIKETVVGLVVLIGQAFSGQGSLDSIAGPVGIVGLVDSATNFGLAYLLGFTAFISINLAVLNILPLPALDGGRLFILVIEGIIRRRIKPVVVNGINAFGFIALILLMIIITINDVIKLF